MTDALTADEAKALLRRYPSEYATPEKLRALAAQLDADSPGRLTVLYSGQTAKGVWSSDVVDSMVESNEDVRVINRSQAAQFFKSREFYHAVAKAHGLADAEQLVLGNYRGPASDWLYHPTEGPWADASARFADKTIGEVRAIVSDAQPARVFGAIEVPHILANHNVTTVEEIPRAVLVARQTTHGDQTAFEMIVARSRENVGRLRVVMDDEGKPLKTGEGPIQMDSREYFVGTQIEGVTPRFTAVTRPLAESMNPPTEYVLAGQQHLSDWQAQVAQAERAVEGARTAQIKRVGAAVGLGIAASAYDAVQTGSRVETRLAQENPLAAQSELTHYAARGTGGWIGGSAVGLVATAASTGPGVVGFIVVGGAAMAGAHVGEHVAKVLDSYKTFKQTDLQGVAWESNGLQWVRQDLGDMLDDGVDKPVKQAFSADPEKTAELSYRASNSATELAIGRLESPRNPFAHAAADSDPPSLRRADWERNPQSGAWERKVVEGFEQPGVPMVRVDTATPERAVELDRASQQVIRDNIANGPAPMAARYEMVHRSEYWERFGAMPPSIESALRDDSMVASDGKLYQRTADGQWQRNGESVVAAGNLRQELESTRAQLQPQLEQHRQQVAAIPPRQLPRLEDIERKDLLATFRVHGVEPNPERLEATLEAVRRTQQEYGVAPLATSLHLALNASGKFDVDSPIEHIGRGADGANRVYAVTSPLEVQMALLDIRSPPPTTPDAPELRIANLSAQQLAALEQVVREANRLGLKRDDVQDAARQAVAGAADGEPEIVIDAAVADRLRPQPKPEASPAPEAPSPVLVKPVVAELAADKMREQQTGNPSVESLRASSAPLDVAQRSAGIATATPSVSPSASEPKNTKVWAEEGSQSVPKPTEPTPVAAPLAEATKQDALEAKAPAPAPPPAPAPAPAPEAPAQVSSTPVPQAAAADNAPSPDDGALRRGDRGQDVEMLQYRLQRVGYRGPDDAPVPERGNFDAATEYAVRQLQRDHGLPDTGRVDPDTVQALAVAQQVKIELQKAASLDPEAKAATQNRPGTSESEVREPTLAQPKQPATVATEPERQSPTAPATHEQRTVESIAAPSPPNAEPQAVVAEDRAATMVVSQAQSTSREPQRGHGGAGESERALGDRVNADRDIASLSPADQAMFAKIRGGAPASVSDEVVAKAMLEAKRNGIPDAERVGQVGMADGKLWVGSVTPGFYAAASVNGPVPSMQDTLKETQVVNRQLAQESAQRGPDDPSRGPKM
ncbi:peptidoglycan-binding protein [Pseudomonas sp. CGJS7]|uniref:peptidoglycan-binding protein n=1 Tax=Pseudomonas sp. CGJS7 TaxID=3109348 RepID=UPI0030099F90